jgi:hypothetical protein
MTTGTPQASSGKPALKRCIILDIHTCMVKELGNPYLYDNMLDKTQSINTARRNLQEWELLKCAVVYNITYETFWRVDIECKSCRVKSHGSHVSIAYNQNTVSLMHFEVTLLTRSDIYPYVIAQKISDCILSFQIPRKVSSCCKI